MRKSRFTESQIVSIVKELDAGATAAEVARRHGGHPNTVGQWRSKYSGLEASDLPRLKQLEAENSEMERIIARQQVDPRHAEPHSKKLLGPSARKEAVRALQAEGLSQRRACAIARCPRRTAQYRLRRDDSDAPIRKRLLELAGQRLRAGWRTLKVFLQRDGIIMNDKLLRRICREEKLQVRPRKRPRVRLVRGPVAPPPVSANDEWGLDFMEDRLWTRRKIRALTIDDRFTREGLAAISISRSPAVASFERSN